MELKEGDVDKPCHDSGAGESDVAAVRDQMGTPCLSSSCTNQRVKKSELADKGKTRYSRIVNCILITLTAGSWIRSHF